MAASARGAASWLGAAGVLLALAIAIFGPTLGLSYAYDDIDYLNAAADVWAGQVSLSDLILRPQGEHFVGGFRLLWQLHAQLMGVSAAVWRGLILTTHLLTAVTVAIVAAAFTTDRIARFVVAFSYVLAAGLSSMWVWFPSGGSLPLGLLGIVGATAAIVHRDRLGPRWSAGLAVAGCAWGLFCESTLVPLILVPATFAVFAKPAGDSRRWRIGWLPIVLVAGAAAVALATIWGYRAATGANALDAASPWTSLRAFVFLLASAPFRLLFPASHLPQLLGSAKGSGLLMVGFGVVCHSLIGLSLALVPRAGAPLRRAALTAIVGPVAWVALVAIGRGYLTTSEIYDADRYYFPFLVPVSLGAGAVAIGLREVLSRASRPTRVLAAIALVACLGAQTVLHAAAVRRRCPANVYNAHGHRLAQLRSLGERVCAAAPVGASLPEGNLFFEDVHNRRLSLRLAYLAAGRSCAGRRLSESLSPELSRVLDPVVAAWSAEHGPAVPTLAFQDGHLVDLRQLAQVDFRAHAAPNAVVDGFFGWENGYRWMGRSGVVAAVVAEPRLVLVAGILAGGEESEIGVSVALIDPVTLRTYPAGELTVKASGNEILVLELPPQVFGTLRGRQVMIRLAADRTVRPQDIVSGSSDNRDLSIRVYSVGFGAV